MLFLICCFIRGRGQLGFSVLDTRGKETLSNLVDPRLGLPAEDERCATCGGTNYDECTGEVTDPGLVQRGFLAVAISELVRHPKLIRIF